MHILGRVSWKCFASVPYFVNIILSNFLYIFLLLIGGKQNSEKLSNYVKLISLDSMNNPAPDKFKGLNKFPVVIYSGVAGLIFACTVFVTVPAQRNVLENNILYLII
jgi:hypothetical protein